MLATRDAFGEQLVESAKENKNIIALSADLSKATRLSKFQQSSPDRFFEVGIAECNMIGIASGLSEYGYKVFMASFASFLTGKYDVIRVSVCYSNAPVVLVGTHAGLAIGKDGVTQMGLEDISLMRSLPNMSVINPATYSEAVATVKYLCENPLIGPHYLRLGRQPVQDVLSEYYKNAPFEFGKAVIAKPGKEITIFSTGCMLPDVLKSANELEEKTSKTVRVVNIHTIKPIDSETIVRCARESSFLFSVEDHTIVGGLGTSISEILTERYPKKLVRIGLNDVFPESGPPSDLYEKYGLSSQQITKRIMNELDK